MLRSHHCGQVNRQLLNEKVQLAGWVSSDRNLGGLLFIDIRDRYGKVQLVFDPEEEELYSLASKLRAEDVIGIIGLVRPRPDENINEEMKSGEVEVLVKHLTILNKSKTTPFEVKDSIDVIEDNRLKYRYLDLRREKIQGNIVFRSKCTQVIRNFLHSEDFAEIETPLLMKSTPEGARDFLVPYRNFPGRFYALPQSPQTYKQILMVSGFDRYFQIAKCFRDEDLRKDRQPEFTQIDIEMSFVEEDDIFDLSEKLMQDLYKQVLNIDIQIPFDRIDYEQAMNIYGTDKPDRRFGLELKDVTSIFVDSEFNVFKKVSDGGGKIICLSTSEAKHYSRKQIDKLTELVKKYGAKGLAFLKISDGEFSGSILKFLSANELSNLKENLDLSEDSLLLFIADKTEVAQISAGALRLQLGNDLDLIDKSKIDFHWITNFPMFEYDEADERYIAMHHPFTSPQSDILQNEKEITSELKARAYDLVLNGNEIAGGSIRIHNKEVQKRVFSLLKIGEKEAHDKFGFLLDALEYGAPPHGGIAFGMDRILMLMLNEESIREVIAFPKTTSGNSLMDNSPSEVNNEQLKELHISLDG